jgi:hypothetical protein
MSDTPDGPGRGEETDESVTVTVDRTVAWRVGFAADHLTRDAVDVDRYPFTYRLELLVRGHEAFHEREGRSWRAAATGEVSPGGLVDPATVPGETSVSLDPDLLRRLTEAVRVEYPGRDAAASPPGERVALLAAAWNEYHAPRGVGWTPA